MKRSSLPFLALLAVLLVLLTSPVSAAQPAPKPNILFVLADQWRAQAFGHAGDPNVKTPHLDRLQREGIQFVNAISGMPVCCPYRASLMTGQRPLTHGVFMNDVPLAPDAVSLAKVLRDAGYDTGYIGKWHIDGHGRSSFIPRERRQGFDYWKVLECTHSYSNSFYFADEPKKLKWDGYDPIAQTRDAQQYLRDHARSAKPFCLFLAWGPPHDPYQIVPAKYRSLYPTNTIQLRPNVPKAMQAQAQRMLSGYYGHCTALDECFGELRATLAEAGLEENTLLIFTSDHGDLLGSHGGRNKQQPYDESLRVPFLLRWPAGLGTAPKRLDALLNAEDLMPTLLGLCGAAIPRTVEGLDFSGYLRGGPNPSDGATLISCVAPFGQWTRRMGGQEYRGVRTLRYTYVRSLHGSWLLFDNENDPFQLKNLSGMRRYAAVEAELDALLKRKLAEAHDQFRPGGEYISQRGYPLDKTGTVPYAP